MSAAEINIFLGEGIGHIKLSISDQGEAGSPSTMSPASLLDIYKSFCDEAASMGIVLGKDKPRGNWAGGAGKRPETPSPAGVTPPMHCGEPAEFKEAWVNQKTGKTVNPKFQCRSATCPDKAVTGYPWSVFLDRWQKVQAENGE